MKKTIVLANLGTPEDCSPIAVYRYLQEFLSDPRVIDISRLGRFILTNFMIAPFRARKSAAAYKSVWQSDGSPLMNNSQSLQHALAEKLGADYNVVFCMRYGNPSIKQVVSELGEATNILFIPLFPQYSSAATGSAIERFVQTYSQKWNLPKLQIIDQFYDHPAFINAYAKIINQHVASQQVDLLLFSYHGLPERHITKSACAAKCDHQNACPIVDSTNHFCYRAQCYATSRALARALNLADNAYSVAFQSRLGRTPWIKPYTDLILPELITKGIKDIAVVCPSFVADCLETLEEVNIRAREQWQALGGRNFVFIPCLNANPQWVEGLAKMVHKTLND